MATFVRQCGRLFSSNALRYCHVANISKSQNILGIRNFHKGHISFAERKFSEKHEWVDMNGNVGTIGISDYAQESLGDIVYCQLPEPGDEFEVGDDCGAMESVKAASEIYSPLTGKIIEKNNKVEEEPGIINKSPYEQGWLFKMEITKPDELDSLMDEAGYEKYLKSQDD